MESRLPQELKLRYGPVAIVLTDEKPEGADQFKEGTWGCVIAMFSAAAKGGVAVFDKETVGCGGGSIGLGFRDKYEGHPGGIEYFLFDRAGARATPKVRATKRPPNLPGRLSTNCRPH